MNITQKKSTRLYDYTQQRRATKYLPSCTRNPVLFGIHIRFEYCYNNNVMIYRTTLACATDWVTNIFIRTIQRRLSATVSWYCITLAEILHNMHVLLQVFRCVAYAKQHEDVRIEITSGRDYRSRVLNVIEISKNRVQKKKKFIIDMKIVVH